MKSPPSDMPSDIGIASSTTLRNLTLTWGARTYVMAILNLTPDSFSGDGLAADAGDLAADVHDAADPSAGRVIDRAVDRAALAIAEGADILDVGGESTRPGARPVEVDEELARVVPVIRALRARFDVPISVDTSKAAVAVEGLDAGADLVNDVWGLRADPDLAGLVARRGVPVIIMHNRSAPADVAVAERVGGFYARADYADLIADVRRELRVSVEIARRAGIADARIILDPGIGFGKTPPQNLELLDRTDAIRALGFPMLVGPSRKSFIGLTLDLPPDDRVEGTAAAVAVAITRGADIVRVHDVRPMVRVARMTDAIVRRAVSKP